MVEEGGFEPPKSLTADLQSAPFGRSGTLPYSGATQLLPLELVNGLSSQLSNSPPDCFPNRSTSALLLEFVSRPLRGIIVTKKVELVNGLEPLTC